MRHTRQHVGQALGGAADLRHFCASLGVFFRVPEQGMKEYNILARATITPVLHSKGWERLRFLAPAHTVSPWAFKKVYPKPWLSFVDETHVKYFMEIRDPKDGAVLASYRLTGPVQHPTRDLAALRLAHEKDALEDVRKRRFPFHPSKLRDRPLQTGEEVRVVGYEVVEPPPSGPAVVAGDHSFCEDPNMLMVDTNGGLTARTPRQAFLWTDTPLNPGMCGSAILDESLECCGCVEGVVPPKPVGEDLSEAYRLIEGNACFIESPDIARFLEDEEVA
ncbi:unnamed protein product [Discosporangium mesarthrocarpum]